MKIIIPEMINNGFFRRRKILVNSCGYGEFLQLVGFGFENNV